MMITADQQNAPTAAADKQVTVAASDKLRLREKIGYACQDGSLELYLQFMSLYLLVFYTNVVGIPPALAGTLMLICTIWNAINDPLVGLLVDNHRFKNGEKIRPLLKWATIPTALFVIILFWMPELEATQAFVYALVVYCVMDSFATFLGVPYVSLPSVLTSNPNERVSLSTFAAIGAGLGPLVASAFSVLLMRAFGGVDAVGNVLDQRAGFRGTVIVVMVVFAVCQFVMYAVARERVRPQEAHRERIGLFRAFKILLTERNFMAITGYNLFYSFALTASLTTVVYYSNYILLRPGGEGILAPILIGVALLVLPCVRLVNRLAARRGVLITASIAMLVSKIPLFFAPDSFLAAGVTAALIGVAMGFTVVGINTNLNESIEIAEWRKGYRLEGSVNALRGLILKGAQALLAFVLGMAMQAAGYLAPSAEVLQPVQNEATQLVFLSFFAYFPTVMAVGMLILALLSPTDRDAATMRAAKATAAESGAGIAGISGAAAAEPLAAASPDGV
ncbi:MAG: glycoside-pentoside-hexuronide (GPH):cation symporter [Coriobacteriales bacterium]|jgi:GPH family glycoside/pentoside/hexuronide:cation symporter|nr:glycoside-pentoside-hexuronide (GPH):cation symporter [Coriobacteriales bacterium]